MVNYKYANTLRFLKIHIICQIVSSSGITIIFGLGVVQNDSDTWYEGNLSQSFKNETDVIIKKQTETAVIKRTPLV